MHVYTCIHVCVCAHEVGKRLTPAASPLVCPRGSGAASEVLFISAAETRDSRQCPAWGKTAPPLTPAGHKTDNRRCSEDRLPHPKALGPAPAQAPGLCLSQERGQHCWGLPEPLRNRGFSRDMPRTGTGTSWGWASCLEIVSETHTWPQRLALEPPGLPHPPPCGRKEMTFMQSGGILWMRMVWKSHGHSCGGESSAWCPGARCSLMRQPEQLGEGASQAFRWERSLRATALPPREAGASQATHAWSLVSSTVANTWQE